MNRSSDLMLIASFSSITEKFTCTIHFYTVNAAVYVFTRASVFFLSFIRLQTNDCGFGPRRKTKAVAIADGNVVERRKHSVERTKRGGLT